MNLTESDAEWATRFQTDFATIGFNNARAAGIRMALQSHFIHLG